MTSQDRLRFAFFPGFLGPTGGGAAKSACLHATSLAERGLTVLVEGLHDARGSVDLALHSCDTRSHPWSGTVFDPSSPALMERAAVVLGQVDVVHLNGHYQSWMYKVAALCRSRGVPYVISSRATLDPSALAALPVEQLASAAPR